MSPLVVLRLILRTVRPGCALLVRCALMRHHCASYNTTSKSFTAAARRTCHYSRNSHFNLSAHWTNRGKCPGVGSLVVKFLRSSYDMERRL